MRRIDAWESYSHPDLGTVGNPSESQDPVYTLSTVTNVFVQNGSLAEAGLQFDQLPDLDTEFDLGDAGDNEAIYCLQYSDDPPITVNKEDDTLAANIVSRHEGIGVMFNSKIADKYPSLQFLAPGNPLSNWIVKTLLRYRRM